MIKIAIDKRPLESGHSVRGIGVNTGELIKALIKYKDNSLDLRAVDFSREDLSKFDLVHYTYFHPFFITIPLKKITKTIVTIHDLIPLIYPKYYPPGLRGKTRFLIQKKLINNVDRVITISETSKKDIVRFLKIPEEKVSVVYLASRFEEGVINKNKISEVRNKYQLPSKFVLYVGDVNYNKNIIHLIRACEIAKTPLVICGKQALDVDIYNMNISSVKGVRDYVRFLFNKPHPEIAHFNLLKEEFKSKSVIRLGFVPDEDLEILYSIATVYFQPSFYEGFGLNVIEAMNRNTPVIIAKNNALVEIAGNAALVSDPYNPKDMAEKIKMLYENTELRSKLIVAGKKQAKLYSWEKTAKEIIGIYKEVVNSK